LKLPEIKDYSNLSHEELSVEIKKLKRQQIISAGMIGFFIGIVIYGFLSNGFGWVYISISVFMIYMIARKSGGIKKDLEELNKELSKR
jgi:hypothetical protein